MKYYNLLRLLLLFLFSIRYSHSDSIATTEDNYWKKFDDGEDDYDDYSSEEDKISRNNATTIRLNNIIESNTIKTISIEIGTTSNLESKPTEIKLTEEKCPVICDCDEYFLFANCSNRNIDQIPKMLPISLIGLDLSYNSIEKISKNDLDYLVNLKKISLNNNEITILDEDIFTNNTNLQVIDLATNKIKKIEPNIFHNNPSLSILNLSNNAINIPKTGSLINAPQLEILNLSNCSINEVYDDTFKNTSGLIKLMLDKNDFNKKINTQAFNASMQNLVKLSLPELEQSYILQLCQILQSIDNISFKNFDLSCFEMVAGLSFNESLIASGTQIPLLQKKDINQNQTEISNQNSTTKNILTPTKLPVTRRPSKKNMNTTSGVNVTVEQDDVTQTDDENAIQISSEIINYCLFTIMGLAVIGLLIGIICRKDVYGIKTKLCRTKKNRGPAKSDQTKHGEEIPLNKV